MNQRIYISGKVSGLTQEQATKRFGDAESLLTAIGFDVVNPLKNGLAYDAPWDDHMTRDIAMLFPCDAIYMMDGWLDSTGAQIEYDIAMRMKKTIWFEKNIVRENQRIQRIKNAVHAVTGLHFAQYAVKSRSTQLFYARMLFAYHCRKCRMTLVSIGQYLHRDHSSILYLINKYDNDRRFDPVFAPMAARCEEIIGNINEPFNPVKGRKRHKRKSKK